MKQRKLFRCDALHKNKKKNIGKTAMKSDKRADIYSNKENKGKHPANKEKNKMAKMKPETVLKRMINKLEFKPVSDRTTAIYSHDSEGNLVFVLERDGVWIVRQAFFDGKETRYVNTEYKSNPLNAK